MAYVKNNPIVEGMSGKFGDMIVFRQHPAGKTVQAKAQSPSTKPSTPAQQATRDNFQQAVIYGKGAKTDPEYVATAKPGQSGYNVAIADFMNAPDIQEIDISGYTGLQDQIIIVKVTDDFKVTSVRLSIHNEDGDLVEEGDASSTENGLDWIYTTIAHNSNLSGDRITITATDKPANLSTAERLL